MPLLNTITPSGTHNYQDPKSKVAYFPQNAAHEAISDTNKNSPFTLTITEPEATSPNPKTYDTVAPFQDTADPKSIGKPLTYGPGCIYPPDPNLKKPEISSIDDSTTGGPGCIYPPDPNLKKPEVTVTDHPKKPFEGPTTDEPGCIYPPDPHQNGPDVFVQDDKTDPVVPQKFFEQSLVDTEKPLAKPKANSTFTDSQASPYEASPSTISPISNSEVEMENISHLKQTPDSSDVAAQTDSTLEQNPQLSFKPIFQYGSFIKSSTTHTPNTTANNNNSQNNIIQNILTELKTASDGQEDSPGYIPISLFL